MNVKELRKYTAWGKGLQSPTLTQFYRVLELLDRYMPVPYHEARILDIGCGTGSLTIPLASLGAKVVGIDVHPPSIEAARRKCPFANARFEVCDAEELRMEGEFDALLCVSVLEHLRAPARLLRSLPHLLRKDGVLLIVVPNAYGPHEILEPVLQRLLANRKIVNAFRTMADLLLGYRKPRPYVGAMLNPDTPHIQKLTLHAMKKLVASNGFSVQAVSGLNFVSVVLPFSFLTHKIRFLERWDTALAKALPVVASDLCVVCKKT